MKLSMGEDSCSSQETEKGRESTFLVATLWSPFETMTSGKGGNVRHSIGSPGPIGTNLKIAIVLLLEVIQTE